MSEAGVLIGITLLALAIAGLRLFRRFRPLLAASASGRADRPGERLLGVVREFALHRRLLRSPMGGVCHALIVVGFIVLLTSKVRAYAEIVAPESDLLRWALPWHDPAVVAMLLGLALAVVNRLWLGRRRFVGSNHRDAALILGAIALIVLASEAGAVAHVLAQPADAGVFPLAAWLAPPLAQALPLTPGGASAAENGLRWLHLVAALAIFAYLPGSKHLHVLTGLPNLFFRDLGPRGRLWPQAVVPPPPETLAAQSWKSLFDLYACSECGRCQAVCPAYAAGHPLSPKAVVIDLRRHLVATAHGTVSPATPVAGAVIAEERLWSCTTCYACMVACPLRVEPLPKIVDLRRALVEQGQLDPALTTTLNAARRYGNVFKRPARQRPKWAEELEFTIADAREEVVEYLWFVGDHASFHPAMAERSRRFARLLQAAGVSFGLLQADERSSGNDIRRIGEEDLFQELARDNIEAISRCRYRAVVTTDPHAFNTLLNEYPQFGLTAPVVHHSELLAELLTTGRLPVPPAPPRRVTYHDPCYLGRYNGRYQAARTIIRHLGHDLREMPRHRENGFCCGAGGGRIFLSDDTPGPRPAEIRLREAAAIGGVEWLIVACPKDYVMFGDALKSIENNAIVAVKELTDLFFDEVGTSDR